MSIPRDAGIMLLLIISDTLLLKLLNCTEEDVSGAELAEHRGEPRSKGCRC